MGLFFNYDKPGRGISEEEAKKRNYFGILGRKFTGVMKISLLYFFVNIILFVALGLIAAPVFLENSEITEPFIKEIELVVTSQRIMSPIPFIILALFAPTTAGLTYVCRNFAKQEPVFIASDFFEHTKKNFGQAIAAGFIMSLFLFLYITSLFYYIHKSYTVIVIIMLSLGMTAALASFYVFPLMVTFKLSLPAIFKNSLILAIMNLPQNMLVFIVLSALHIILILRFPILWILLMPLFLIGFSSYTMNFVAWNIIAKNLEKSETEETPE